MEFSGVLPDMFPYSALFGTTVDTCCVSLWSLFGKQTGHAQCKLCPDQPVEILQVQFLDKFDVPVVLRQVRSVLSVCRPWRSHRCRSWLCY